MGVIFSRFKKKRTALQMLEQIESKISSIENFQQITEHKQKKIVGRLILGSVSFYIVAALVFYFYFFPTSLKNRILYIIPLLIFPIVVVLMKRLVTWYYKRQISSNEEKLSDLKAEKKQMLDNVMEKETYKVAKEILEKFAPDQLRKNVTPSFPVARVQPIKSSSELQPLKKDLKPWTPKPVQPIQPRSLQILGVPNIGRNESNGAHLPQRLQLARPILPKERTNIDKLVEFLVGDGPNNRYALICKKCSSHNGMALKEEFLFIAFRCCYCGFMNPARKQRPQAPRLDLKSAIAENLHSSDSETESEEDIKHTEEVLNNKHEEKDSDSIRSYNEELKTDEESGENVKPTDEVSGINGEEKESDATIRSYDEELKTDDGDTGIINQAPEKSNAEKKVD